MMRGTAQAPAWCRVEASAGRALGPAMIALCLVGCASSAPRATKAARVRLLVTESARPLVGRLRRPFLALSARDPRRALTTAAGPTTNPSEPGVGKRAAAALEAARRAYRELDFAGAVQRLTTAESELVAHAREPAHFAQLAEIVFWRGISHLAQGEKEAARQAARWALRLGYPLPRGKHAPEIERFVERVSAADRPTGGLLLLTEPADARVLLDGQALRRPPDGAPSRVEAGLHHLRIDRLGHRGQGLVRLVAPGKVDRLEVDLQRLERPAAAGEILARLGPRGEPPADRDLPADRELLHRVLDDDGWLALSAETQPPMAAVLWLSDPQKPVLRCRGTDAPLTECLAQGIYRLATGKDPPAERPAKQPLYKRWWFWTAVAAVGAGAALGVYFGTRDGDQGTDIDIGIRGRSLNWR